MSIKENIQTLKDELSSEEKFFESAIRTERFVKKYQKPLMVSVISLLFIVAGAIAYQAYNQSKIDNSNIALNTLLTNTNDTSALKTLSQENAPLYDLYTLSNAIKKGDVKTLQSLEKSEALAVAEIASYEVAVLNNDQNALEKYTKKQGAVYQDLALIDTAVLSIQKGDTKSVQSKLALIKEDSVMYPVAQMLSHFGVKQ